MSKDFQRIEKVVSIVVGKPTTFLSYLIWLACCWSFAQSCRFCTWLRNRFAKHKSSAKPTSRGKPSASSP